MNPQTIVLKFGGTSVGSLERIKGVAKLVAQARKEAFPIVVVSAMSGETNRLIQLARDLSPSPQGAAFDLLVASGEQVSCSLVALALQDLGVSARPMLAHQVGIETDALFSNARILKIDREKLDGIIAGGEIPVIAGFQGVDAESGQVTTLGRGGSDTSAVAIAAALKSKRCDIYTDVDGIYTADPRIVKNARRIPRLSYDEMMELASLGAKVLHMRCVELAAKHGVPLRVLSTFAPENGGSELVSQSDTLESPVVSAITSDAAEALLDVKLKESEAQFPARFFRPLADQGINVDVIVKSPAQLDGTCTLSFTVPKLDCAKAEKILSPYPVHVAQTSVVKVSIVGIGMRTHSGVAAKMFETLEKNDIPILLVTTSEIKVSVLVREEQKDIAIRSLHDAFGL
ncbi:MAG: aspartate kinase [Oligoflexia bacterium]